MEGLGCWVWVREARGRAWAWAYPLNRFFSLIGYLTCLNRTELKTE
uniref:Uncharacterized protein n=1 Tax=Manihot esculenta TaxID=3983 RepID=A0A2C9U4G6_MANES